MFNLSVADDFTAEEVIFVLNASSLNPCYTVNIIDDNLYELNESFVVLLNSTDPSVFISKPTAIVTITDDDGKYQE